MNDLLSWAGALRTRTQIIQYAFFGIFAGLALLSFLQSREILGISDEKGSSPALLVQAVEGRVNGISLSLLSYLERHQPVTLTHIQTEGFEVDRLLGRLKDLMEDKPQLFEQVEKALKDMRDETRSVLEADYARAARLSNLEICQTNAAAPVSRKRSRNAPTVRGCGTEAEELRLAEVKVQASLKNYAQKRNALSAILQDHFIAGSFQSKRQKLERALSVGIVYAGFSILLLLGAAILMRTWTKRLNEQLVGPLQHLLRCVEAAVKGDVTSIPEIRTWDEVGQLSDAVGRLVKVVGRSENLVYHLAALVESSGEAIISYTLDGTILSWNKGAQRIYGYSAEEMKGKPFTKLAINEDKAETLFRLERLRRGERILPFETQHQARNGRTVRALVRISAIHDSKRQVIGASFCAQELGANGLLRSSAASDTTLSI